MSRFRRADGGSPDKAPCRRWAEGRGGIPAVRRAAPASSRRGIAGWRSRGSRGPPVPGAALRLSADSGCGRAGRRPPVPAASTGNLAGRAVRRWPDGSPGRWGCGWRRWPGRGRAGRWRTGAWRLPWTAGFLFCYGRPTVPACWPAVGADVNRSNGRDDQVQARVAFLALAGALGRHVVGLHELVALQGLQVDIEAPQAMQVLEHVGGGVAQRLAVELLVAQGQRAVAATVDVPDLDVRLAVAEVVLRARVSRMVR